MAPSPELGQPKAPDKGDTKNDLKNKDGDNKDNENHKGSESSQPDSEVPAATKELGSWDERQLKALLDEAITYRTPLDLKHKSETFKELLQHAEREDKEPDFTFHFQKSKKHTSNRHTQGGSLQDLAETDNLDIEYLSNKPNHQRQQKTHSSVSSRQREGGSLPTNVNVSYGCNPYEPPFMNDIKHRKKGKGSKQDQYGYRGVGNVNINTEESHPIIDGKLVGDTVIDIGEFDSDETQHLLAHDSLAQSKIDSNCDEEGTELAVYQKIPRIQANRQFTSQAKFEISEASLASGASTSSATGQSSSSRLHHHQNVDKTVPFHMIENSNAKNNGDLNATMQLSSGYNSVKSIVDTKAELNRSTVPILMANQMGNGKFITSNMITQKMLDENANSVQSFNPSIPSLGGGSSGAGGSTGNSKKSKKSKSERNTIIVDYSKKEGFRGTDEINDLVRYIEETETEKNRTSKHGGTGSNNTSNVGNTHILSNTNKKQKVNSGNKKDGKLKKCNSLEELSSCSKLKELKEQNVVVSSSSSSSSGASQPTTNQKLNSTNNENHIEVTLCIRPSNTNLKKNSDPTSTSVITSPLSISSTIASTSGTATTVTNNNKKLAQQKRSERRSWGTEELNFLNERKKGLTEDDHGNCQSKMSSAVFSESTQNFEHTVSNTVNETTTRTTITLSAEQALLQTSLSNLNLETSEFLLVTKKKKPKKKLDETNGRNTNINHNQNSKTNNNNSGNNRGQNIRSKYNTNGIGNNNNNHGGGSNIVNREKDGHHQSHFSNDRDIYLNSFNANENSNRRKSDTSVPPSERSDSSDHDSVHSLPVESLVTKQLRETTPPATAPNQLNQISYADIAKKANVTSQLIPQTADHPVQTSIIGDKCTDEPHRNELIDAIPKQLTYSKNLADVKTNAIAHAASTTIPSLPNGDIKTLQKSKSVESDSYNVSIDHYPALEKTVKPKNSHQPSLGRNINAPIINTSSVLDGKKETVGNLINYAVVLGLEGARSTPSVKSCEDTHKVTMTLTSIATMTNAKAIEPIEVSQIEKHMVEEMYHQHRTALPNSKPSLKQVVVNNNNNININKLNEFTHGAGSIIIPAPAVIESNDCGLGSGHVTTVGTMTKRQQHYHHQTPQSFPTLHSQQPLHHMPIQQPLSHLEQQPQHHNHIKKDKPHTNRSADSLWNNNRPAVIILNDSRDSDKSNNDITFGFEVNQNLLFGDFNEDELNLFEQTNVTKSNVNNNQYQLQTAVMPSNVSQSTGSTNLDASDYFSISSDTSSTFDGSSTNMCIVNSIIKQTDELPSSQQQPNLLLSTGTGHGGDGVSGCVNSKSKLLRETSGDTIAMEVEMLNDCQMPVVLNNKNATNNKNLENLAQKNKHLMKDASVSTSGDSAVVTVVNATNNNKNDVGLVAATTTTTSVVAMQINFVPPNGGECKFLGYNHDKVVMFVGKAWDDIISGSKGNTQYYNGQ